MSRPVVVSAFKRDTLSLLGASLFWAVYIGVRRVQNLGLMVWGLGLAWLNVGPCRIETKSAKNQKTRT